TTDQHAGEPGRMSRAQFWSVLGLALALFLFEAGPVWRHPWDMDLLNRAIFWSYVLIPLLVIGCLAWSKRLTLRVFVVDTLVLVLIKYSCTFAFALVLWEVTPFPQHVREASLPLRASALEAEPAPAPTPLDPATTGAVEGSVTDAAGRPLAGALVWIAGGLEAHVFAPPSAPASIAHADAGMIPSLAVVQANQQILARSADGKLHTMVAVKDGRTLFNAPLLPSGESSRVSFREAEGLVTVRCNVHPGAGEAEGKILVLGHPFFARTDATGRFAFRGVPAGRVQLATHVDGRYGPEQVVDITPGGDVKLTLAQDLLTKRVWSLKDAPSELRE
ncbi:MAG: hypothetical protein ACMG6S_19605, partial [Byssovorax sp.]